MASKLNGYRFKPGEALHIDYYVNDKERSNNYVKCTFIRRLANNNLLVHLGDSEEYDYVFELSFNSDKMLQYDAVTGECYGNMHCTKVYYK